MSTKIFGQKVAEHKHENDTNEKFVTKFQESMHKFLSLIRRFAMRRVYVLILVKPKSVGSRRVYVVAIFLID